AAVALLTGLQERVAAGRQRAGVGAAVEGLVVAGVALVAAVGHSAAAAGRDTLVTAVAIVVVSAGIAALAGPLAPVAAHLAGAGPVPVPRRLALLCRAGRRTAVVAAAPLGALLHDPVAAGRQRARVGACVGVDVVAVVALFTGLLDPVAAPGLVAVTIAVTVA